MKALFKDGWIKASPFNSQSKRLSKEYTVIYKVRNSLGSKLYIEDSTAKVSLINNDMINLSEVPMNEITQLRIFNYVFTSEQRELYAEGKYYYNQITWSLKLKRRVLRMTYRLRRLKNRLFIKG